MRHAHLPFLLLLLVAMVLGGCSMAPRRVAIMDFENATGSPDCDKLAVAIPEYLTQYLTGYDSMHVLERQDIHRFLAEIDSDPSDTRRLSRWQKLGQKINAQYLIAGSCSRLDQNFIITARLFSVETGQIIPGTASTKTCTREYEIFDRAKNMAADLAYQLKYRTHGVLESVPAQTAQTAQGGEQGTVTPVPVAYERATLPDLGGGR